MTRVLLILAAGLAITACDSDPGAAEDSATESVDDVISYEAAMDAQSELVAEITGVLENVTDESTAKAAAPRIEELSGELQRLAIRINAMPPLPYAEQQRISEQRKGSTAARRKAGKQMLKIEQYPVLKEAWSRGMKGAEGSAGNI